ncbi:MAG: DUF481 domain-containing protein [Terriglobales bacterium]
MRYFRRIAFGLTGCLLLTCPFTTFAQSGNNPDLLLLRDGSKLLGHVQSATATAVVFASQAAGTVTVAWSQIQQLDTSETFAVVETGMRLEQATDARSVPQGTIHLSQNNLQVTSAAGTAGPQSVPLAKVTEIVPEADFQAAFHPTNLFGGWKGTATGGVSLVEATQNSRTFNAAVHVAQTVPDVNWLAPRTRSSVNLDEAYGKLTQPGVPAVKTSLFHLDAERDWYLAPRWFAFANGAWDHSFSQGLSLQQTFGGGLGWVALKSPAQELDVKASIDYINQRFSTPGLNTSLVGSTFGETSLRKLMHGIQLNEQAGITPAWNNTKAYSAFASAALTFPVYHHLGFTLGTLDNYLNNPPPGFKKNSFQFTAGATYAF